MFTDYLKAALRNHRRNRLYTAINVIGLAIGITAVLLAILYIKDENSFDAFHTHHKDLYRITTTITQDNNTQTTGGTGQVHGPAFKAQVPEVQDFVRVMGGDIYGDVTANNKVLQQQLLFVDEHFFNLFSFQLLKGDPQTALQDIGGAVITESTALKYFNRIDVVGQLLSMNADPSARKLGKPLVVTAVVKDPPRNSSIRFDVLLPFRFMQLSFEDTDWRNLYLSTFVLLQPGADLSAVSRKLNNTRKDASLRFGLQNITDMHLHPLYVGADADSKEGGIINGSKPIFSWLFLGIAIFILLMAGINFINISLAGSLKRIKEVGIRKINGSSNVQMMLQFLLESAVLCLAAFLLALLLTWGALPTFNQLTGKDLILAQVLDISLLGYCIVVLAGIVLLTGVYPSYVLSGLKPVQALAGKQKLLGRNMLGRMLIVLQFSLAIFLLLFTLLFYRQMNYVRTKDLGYNPQQIIRAYIGGEPDLPKVKALLKNELLKQPAVKMVSFGGTRSGTSQVKVNGSSTAAAHMVIDEDYLPAMGITLSAGRNFSTAYATDKTGGAIVNEAFVKAAGLTDPIGKQIHTDEYFDKDVKTIVGVVKDFHTGSLREHIQPTVMIMSSWFGRTIWLKLAPTGQQHALAAFEAAYKKALPDAVFSYSYLDQLNMQEYAQELRWKKIINIATVLSILICCAGLFGLAHIATHQRIKEIGIRRVLGADVMSIVTLFSKNFLQLVGIAFIIASPVAWGAMNSWLQHFAYRVPLNGWIFLAAGAFALLIALGTITLQVCRAVVLAPVRNLSAD